MRTLEQRIIRFFDTEMRAAEGEEMILEGHVVKFGKETQIGGGKYGFKEVVSRGVLEGADISQAILAKNHGKEPFARVSNGSLTIAEDDIGVKVRAKILDTVAGIDFYKEIRAGLISKMSWAAQIADDLWEYARGAGEQDRRIIKRFGKVLDVSAVTFPAYDDTLIAARDEEMAFREKQIYVRQIEELNKILGGGK